MFNTGESDDRIRTPTVTEQLFEDPSELLKARAREPEGLRKMFMVSTMAHALVIVSLLINPGYWLSGQDVEANEIVMSIRLGGPDGPGVGGLTPLDGRPIQEILPLPEARRPQWIQPPMPTPPAMTIPVENARRRPENNTDIQTAPDEARGRTPTRGPELRQGTAMAETDTAGIGIGLSTGGAGGGGGELNVADFCCPEYLATMLELIRRRWDSNQQVPGRVAVRFTIQRNGTIENVGLHGGSGYISLDLSAQRAVLLTRQLPRLPSAFPEDSLTVRLTFEYQR